MQYRIISLILIIIFYLIYLYKLISLNKKSIKTNQAGKGNKSKKVIMIEKIMSLSNILVIIAQLFSIIWAPIIDNDLLKITGIIVGILAILFFASATITMKNNWRVGIPEEKTSLVINGIYKWSRNPAFVGFDLLYLSTTMIFFNIPLLVIAIWAGTMLHIQILQEEKHMSKIFGKEYENYKKNTLRYFGRI